MPCEFRLRTWLPAIPVITLLISQPAMSSASSIARWIDCTVDSMFTTTPRFSPREGFEPRPMTSSRSSAEISPTIATTFDVPMSRPTINLRSSRLPTVHRRCRSFIHVSTPIPDLRHRGNAGRLRLAPTHGEPVRVTQVDVRDSLELVRERRRHDVEEPIEALVDVAAAETNLLAAAEHEQPRAALVHRQALQREVGLGQLAAHGEVAARNLALAAARTREPRQFREVVLRLLREQLAANVQQTVLAPARGGLMLRDPHDQRVGP